jgi:uridine kinase
MADESLIVAIVGPTCSGKSTASEQVQQALGDACSILHQDHFYKTAKADNNFDVPSAIDMPELVAVLKQIKKGQTVKIPQYDFITHSRLKQKVWFEPKRITIVEGILLFCDDELLDLIDIKVYIKSDPNITKKRRLERDVRERGRTLESVIEQYKKHVEPSNKDYVEPSQIHATHLLIDNSDFTFQGMDTLITDINIQIGFHPQ